MTTSRDRLSAPRVRWLFALVASVASVASVPWLSGCSSDKSDPSDASDVDSDSDTDTDTDTDSDTDTDTDTDSDTDTDTDTDSDTDSDGGTDTDADSDSDLPPGCTLVTANSALDWEGSNGLYGDVMVWTEFNWDTTTPELKKRQLSTGAISTLIGDPGYEENPVIWGNWVFWEHSTGTSWTTREVYRTSLSALEPQQLTDNSCADGIVRGGENYFIHRQNCDGSDVEPLILEQISPASSEEITPDSSSPPGTSGTMFDGTRYVAWGWHDADLGGNDLIYLFDIENPTTLSEPLYADANGQAGGVIADGKIYAMTYDVGVTDEWDIWIYDIASSAMDWLDHSPWDQIGPVVSGHVVAYLDTEELASSYYTNGMIANMELKDLETSVTNQITAEAGRYCGMAISDKYLVYENCATYDLIVCNLEAGGFVDAAGHVCPPTGCPEIDAGVDGGADAGE